LSLREPLRRFPATGWSSQHHCRRAGFACELRRVFPNVARI
jgi:hypothetical protein